MKHKAINVALQSYQDKFHERNIPFLQPAMQLQNKMLRCELQEKKNYPILFRATLLDTAQHRICHSPLAAQVCSGEPIRGRYLPMHGDGDFLQVV